MIMFIPDNTDQKANSSSRATHADRFAFIDT